MARFTNQAQLRYGNSVANSNIAVGEILEVLSAAKTAVRTSYGQNDTVTYIISLINSGNTAINGLTLTDDLGTYAFGTSTLVPLTYLSGTIRYYTNGMLQSTPAVTLESPLTITGISVPANGNAVIVYETAVNEFAPFATASSITNRVTITGTGLGTPITAEETVTAASTPVLTITKSVSPVPVTENGILTYTFQIQNRGNAAADTTTGVIVTDTFDPILTNLSVTYNGTTLTQGTDYTYDETTGEFATTAGVIVVPAATFSQNPDTGSYLISPGSGTLIVTGTV